MSDCRICGSGDDIHQHHLSYDRKLTVPICADCHYSLHTNEVHPLYPQEKVEGDSTVVENSPEKLGGAMDYNDSWRLGDKRWVVIDGDEYENYVVDIEGNVGILVGVNQAIGLLKLASDALADMMDNSDVSEEQLQYAMHQLDEIISEQKERVGGVDE